MAQTAAAGPTACGRDATEVCPLAQSSFAEDDRAGQTQFGRYRRVRRGRRNPHQGERTRSGLHLVVGVHVVFEQHRDSMQGTPRSLGPAFAVELQRDPPRIRIYLDDRIHTRP